MAWYPIYCHKTTGTDPPVTGPGYLCYEHRTGRLIRPAVEREASAANQAAADGAALATTKAGHGMTAGLRYHGEYGVEVQLMQVVSCCMGAAMTCAHSRSPSPMRSGRSTDLTTGT